MTSFREIHISFMWPSHVREGRAASAVKTHKTQVKYTNHATREGGEFSATNQGAERESDAFDRRPFLGVAGGCRQSSRTEVGKVAAALKQRSGSALIALK